jgi:DNA-binding beta-propeller fold protein YncE
MAPNGKTAYVANADSQSLTPISTATGKPGRAIKVPLLYNPGTMAITPDGKTLYVVSPTGAVRPVSTATGKVGRAIRLPAGVQATQIAIAPNGKTAWTLDAHSVTPISTATNKAGRPIKVGSGPIAIAFTP